MLKIHGNIETSNVDGPGKRSIIHTSGCTVGCAGCFNPHTHEDGEATVEWDCEALAGAMLAPGLDGVTISGGEPTDQLEGLYGLLCELRGLGCDSIVVYTGRRIEWLREHHPQSDLWRDIERAKLIDVLIDGPYVRRRPETVRTCGSANQRIHLLTRRHARAEFDARGVEVQVNDAGNIIVLGFPTAEMLETFSRI